MHQSQWMRWLPLTVLVVTGACQVDEVSIDYFCRTQCDSKEVEPVSFQSIGVNERDVDELVKELLADPTVNISMVPDAIEKQLYKSTILLTLNAVYSLIFMLNGVNIFAHELCLTVDRNQKSKSVLSKALAKTAAAEIDDVILQEVADRMLQNPAINSVWIPDTLEREIYRACLQVIFRILQVVLSSVKIKLCGHELSLRLGSVSKELHQAALTVSAKDEKDRQSILTPIDMEILRKMAKGAGVNEASDDYWWNRAFTSKEFVENLHVSLYSLILGVLDDVFAELQIQVLSDTINLDLVAAKEIVPHEVEEAAKEVATTNQASKSSNKTSMGVSVDSFAAASFAAGVGVGVALMAVISGPSK